MLAWSGIGHNLASCRAGPSFRIQTDTHIVQQLVCSMLLATRPSLPWISPLPPAKGSPNVHLHSSTCSCAQFNLLPKANTSFGRLSFQFSAASDWNELQKSLKLEIYISLTSFKHQLSEQLINRCSCT
jgi:hypothetical protein